ncbi:MAG: patatin-like phospholipase family protein, partial [Candidatus Eremiobacteraeota bacterium]|nr:patatin-like phospholipase family protein [Candidatus Eremiobacteraeota bacterium]
FYYDPDELLAYFPHHVIDWMQKHPRKAKDDSERQHFEERAKQNKLPLPSAADLPVIVATRMSLAFPILLSAVPLYAADYSERTPHDSLPELERCWFSDGGISSNFPITLFDSPLPRWPTFAINLGSFTKTNPQETDETKNVYMPASNAAGTLPTFAKITSLPSFLSGVLDAMQNWNDNTQTRLPGYRDRIVTVLLSDKEGGLNLDMPPDILEKLRLRGAAAGKLIADRFSDPSVLDPDKVGMNWENHRWLRYRSSMRSIKTYLTAFKKSIDNPEPPDVRYEALIAAAAGTPVRHYPIDPDARAQVEAVTEDIVRAGSAIDPIATLDDNLPKPPPYLTQRASLDT